MKSIKIVLKKQALKNDKTYTDEANITDGISITKYERGADAQKSFLALKQAGTDASLYKNTIIQRWKDKNSKEITELTLKQIEELKKKMRKKLKITYKIHKITI